MSLFTVVITIKRESAHKYVRLEEGKMVITPFGWEYFLSMLFKMMAEAGIKENQLLPETLEVRPFFYPSESEDEVYLIEMEYKD